MILSLFRKQKIENSHPDEYQEADTFLRSGFICKNWECLLEAQKSSKKAQVETYTYKQDFSV